MSEKKKLRVLIADDEIHIRMMLKMAMKSSGASLPEKMSGTKTIFREPVKLSTGGFSILPSSSAMILFPVYSSGLLRFCNH